MEFRFLQSASLPIILELENGRQLKSFYIRKKISFPNFRVSFEVFVVDHLKWHFLETWDSFKCESAICVTLHDNVHNIVCFLIQSTF